MREEMITSLPTGIKRIIKELKKCSIKNEGVILDCGCGNGKIAKYFSSQFKSGKVFGIDISLEQLKIAKKDGNMVLAADLDKKQKLPFKDNCLDLVFCNHVIEHLLDPDHLLDEIYRVLKRDGALVLTTPNLAAWYNRIALLLGFQPHFTEVSLRHNVGKLYYGTLKTDSHAALGGHIRIFTYTAIKRLLEIHGFLMKASFSYGHPALLDSKLMGVFEYLSQMNKTLSSTLCFICKKS